MRVIGVIDLSAGRAVHARAGDRANYRPVESHLLSKPGDAGALARAYREQLGLDELYVADLDALAGRPPQWEILRAVAATGVRVLVDIGATAPGDALRAIEQGAARVVVALETLPSFDALTSIVDVVGRERVVFSLDLRDGVPILLYEDAGHVGSPMELVGRAVQSGVAAMIVLDLARVGTGAGLDDALLGAIHRDHPALELLAGGGVRDRADLERLAECGCDGALVATALLGGSLDRRDVEVMRGADAQSQAQRSDSR